MLKQFFLRCFLYTTYFLLVLYIYDNYLVDLYENRGSNALLDYVYRIVLAFFTAIVCALVTPSIVKSPGDFIVTIFSLAAIPSVVILQGASDYVVDSMGYHFSVFFSLSILGIANKYQPKNVSSNWVVDNRVLYFFVALNLLALMIILYGSIGHLSFGYNEHYLRRAATKVIFPSGSIISYYISILVQGVYPIILIVSLLTNNYKLLLLSILNVVVLWAAAGEKYPIFILVLSISVVCIYKYKKLGIPLSLLLIPACVTLLAGVVEAEYFNSIYINDYFLRRVYAVPAVLSDAAGMYYDTLGINYYCDSLLGFLSCEVKDTPITYLISGKILSNPEMNANVNFVAMAFLRLSYMAVFIEIFILSSILVCLNVIFYRKENYYALAVGVMLSLRLLEQSLPTVLLSSGGIVAIIFSIFAYKKIGIKTTVPRCLANG